MRAEEELRRVLKREARRLVKQIDKIDASLVDHDARITELEAMFSNPDQFGDAAQLAASGEQHRELKEKAQSLWEEWEALSLEAERVASRLRELKAD